MYFLFIFIGCKHVSKYVTIKMSKSPSHGESLDCLWSLCTYRALELIKPKTEEKNKNSDKHLSLFLKKHFSYSWWVCLCNSYLWQGGHVTFFLTTITQKVMITERWGFIQHISDYVLDHRDTLGLLNDEKSVKLSVCKTSPWNLF